MGLFGMQLPVVSRASCLITLTRITSSGFTCRTSRFLTKGRYFLISATRNYDGGSECGFLSLSLCEFHVGQSGDYNVELDYIGLSDGSSWNSSYPGVQIRQMDDGEYLRTGEYIYELSAFTPEGISVDVKSGK